MRGPQHRAGNGYGEGWSHSNGMEMSSTLLVICGSSRKNVLDTEYNLDIGIKDYKLTMVLFGQIWKPHLWIYDSILRVSTILNRHSFFSILSRCNGWLVIILLTAWATLPGPVSSAWKDSNCWYKILETTSHWFSPLFSRPLISLLHCQRAYLSTCRQLLRSLWDRDSLNWLTRVHAYLSHTCRWSSLLYLSCAGHATPGVRHTKRRHLSSMFIT